MRLRRFILSYLGVLEYTPPEGENVLAVFLAE
jgi:hypothetical protein